MGGAASSQTPVSASAVGTTGLSKGYMGAQVKEWEAQMAMVGSQAETVAVETKEETPECGYMASDVSAWKEAQKQAAIGNCACCDNKNYGSDSEDEE